MDAATIVIADFIRAGSLPRGAAGGGKGAGYTTILMLKAVRHVAAERRPQTDRYISPAEITTENPGTLRHLERMLVEIEDFCAGHHLRVSVCVTTPSVAMQFVISRLPVAI